VFLQLDLLVQAVAPPAANDDLPEEVKRIIENYTFSHTRINPADLLIPSFMHGYIRDDDVTPRESVRMTTTSSIVSPLIQQCS
jgi:hypothetical protein